MLAGVITFYIFYIFLYFLYPPIFSHKNSHISDILKKQKAPTFPQRVYTYSLEITKRDGTLL